MIGLINLYKPSGMSSSSAVVKIKKLTHISRVGHMGTLDPLAEGVLIIGVGKATRLFDYYLSKTKTYIATFKFGVLTDTLDSEGEVLKQGLKIPSENDIKNILDNLTGEISQLPPKYSAKSINGVKAYKLARQGVEVKLQPKKIFINYINYLGKVSDDEYKFKIDCSSGTYIRSIARDMANLLGTEAIMTALVRTRCGVFNLENSVSLDGLTSENIQDYLVDLNNALAGNREIEIDSSAKIKLLNGVPLHVNCDDGEIVVKFEKQVICIGEVISNKLKIKNYLGE